LTIVITGGGTGGHIYPALAVGRGIRDTVPGARVVFIGSAGPESRVIPEAGFEFYRVMARGLSRRPLQAIGSLVVMGIGFFQAIGRLLALRPRVIVGAGGYVSLPAVMAGGILGVPVVLLEQNLLPGKASRLAARFARRICVSFEDSKRWLPADRVVVTGNPVRREILEVTREEGRRGLGLEPGRFTLLVTGGSQGAQSLNQAVCDNLAGWKERPWQVVHLTGQRHFEEVAARGRALVEGGVLAYRPHPFLEKIGEAYAAADLVVCRSGATTMAEITALGLPALLVPYPYSADGHQDSNARWLEERGAALVVADREISGRLGSLVESLADKPEDLASMAGKSRAQGKPEALEEILAQVRELMGPVAG